MLIGGFFSQSRRDAKVGTRMRRIKILERGPAKRRGRCGGWNGWSLIFF